MNSLGILNEFLILLFTKQNIEVSGWLYKTKTHITHIVYLPFSRVTPPSYIALTSNYSHKDEQDKQSPSLVHILGYCRGGTDSD